MPAKKTSKKKWILIVAVVATLVTVFLLINSILAPVIGRKIMAAVRKGSDNAYTLHFENIHVNVFTGTLTLSTVKLDADTSRLKGKPFVAEGNAREIEVTGIHVLDYWWHKKLEIGALTVEGAEVELIRQKKNTASVGPSETLYQKISGSLKMLSARKITFDDISLHYADHSNSPIRLDLHQVRFEARSLLIDSASQADTSRTLFCKEIIAGIRNFTGSAQQGAYHYTLKSAHYSTYTKRLEATGISVKPQELHRFFAKMQKDRYDFDLDALTIEQFNYQDYLDQNAFHAAKISAGRGSLNIFGDPSGTKTPGDRVTGFPNYVLRQFDTQLLVDTVDISGINVSYSEFNPDDGKIGTVEFAGTRGRFLHISNRPDLLAQNPWCTVQLTSHFMRAGQIKLEAQFNQADKACSYAVKGSLDPMPAVAINPVSMPLGLARIKSGHIEHMDFELRGDRFRNRGNLGLRYRDVDLEMLSNNYHNKPLKTLLANTLVIAPNNPDDAGGTPRAAQLNHARAASKPFFCALWETLSDGIKACAEEKKSATAVPQPHQSLVKKILTAPVRLFKKKT